MKIQYKRSGGIANIVQRIELDSTELPERLQLILQTLRSIGPSEPLHADEFFHELVLEDGRTIRCTDSQCPQPMIQVLEFLTQSRKDAKKKST